MRNWVGLLVAMLTLLVASRGLAQSSVSSVPNPRSNNQWVSDNAHMISDPAEARINQMIDAIEAEQGVEIAVVTVDDVDTATPKDFATALFNHWGIGKADKNNGLLVLMVKGQRRLEMETGYGTEAVLTDGWLKSMQMSHMIPAFKAGRFGDGLEKGVQACIARLRKYPDGIPAAAAPPAVPADQRPGDGGPSAAAPSPSQRSDLPWGWLLFGGVVVAGGTGASVYKHRKNRTCPDCKIRMTMLPEEEDDQHLDAGQRTEEAIGAVDYQFFYCTKCSFTKLIRVGKWFSGYDDCGACGYKALSTSTRTLSSATYESSGLEEVTMSCSHCSFNSSHTRTIPKLVKADTSSSSSSFGGGGGSSFGGGGGSFGGGSSGGGGAGSSW